MQGKKISFTITILSLSMSGKKNLHEGNILYFSLKVCKKKLQSLQKKFFQAVKLARKHISFPCLKRGSDY